MGRDLSFKRVISDRPSRRVLLLAAGTSSYESKRPVSRLFDDSSTIPIMSLVIMGGHGRLSYSNWDIYGAHGHFDHASLQRLRRSAMSLHSRCSQSAIYLSLRFEKSISHDCSLGSTDQCNDSCSVLLFQHCFQFHISGLGSNIWTCFITRTLWPGYDRDQIFEDYRPWIRLEFIVSIRTPQEKGSQGITCIQISLAFVTRLRETSLRILHKTGRVMEYEHCRVQGKIGTSLYYQADLMPGQQHSHMAWKKYIGHAYYCLRVLNNTYVQSAALRDSGCLWRYRALHRLKSLSHSRDCLDLSREGLTGPVGIRRTQHLLILFYATMRRPSDIWSWHAFGDLRYVPKRCSMPQLVHSSACAR